MPHFLIMGYLSPDFDPTKITEAQIEAIHELNREMVRSGVRRFAGGLGAAQTLRPQKNGEVVVTDGPFLETKEQIGGLTIVEVADREAALAWARRGAQIGGGVAEVREIYFFPAPDKEGAGG